MKNKISLIGLLGLLGLLGIFTGDVGFYGFFGFFGFFGFASIKPDERFKENVVLAAKNAFYAGIILYPVIIVLGIFLESSVVYAVGFAVNFAIQLLTFSISLAIYEKKGVSKWE